MQRNYFHKQKWINFHPTHKQLVLVKCSCFYRGTQFFINKMFIKRDEGISLLFIGYPTYQEFLIKK